MRGLVHGERLGTYTLKPPPPISFIIWKPWTFGNISLPIAVESGETKGISAARDACQVRYTICHVTWFV